MLTMTAFPLRGGPSRIVTTSKLRTLWSLIAIFHEFSFPSADTGVQDPFIHLKRFDFWKCNNACSLELVLLHVLDLANILADSLGKFFSSGLKLGKKTEICLFTCAVLTYHKD